MKEHYLFYISLALLVVHEMDAARHPKNNFRNTFPLLVIFLPGIFSPGDLLIRRS
jgi:hypothetical protein